MEIVSGAGGAQTLERTDIKDSETLKQFWGEKERNGELYASTK